MGFDAFIRFFLPREERFQALLEHDTGNLVRAAELFQVIAKARDLEQRRVKLVEFKALEHDGDQLTRRIFEALNSTFITPFDREDIRAIAVDVDDVLDYLEGIAQFLVLFEIRDAPEPLTRFAEILFELCRQIDEITNGRYTSQGDSLWMPLLLTFGPFLLVIGLLYVLISRGLRQAGGGGGMLGNFGKSKHRQLTKEMTGITFSTGDGANDTTMTFTGMLVSMAAGRKWLALPIFAQGMVLLHSLQGFYPLLPLFRRIGLRTEQEIGAERYALKALRGDFQELRGGQRQGDPAERADRAFEAAQPVQ